MFGKRGTLIELLGIVLLLLVSSLLLVSCDSGSGGVNNGTDTYALVIEPEYPFIEAGEHTAFIVSLENSSGAKLHHTPLNFYVKNLYHPSHSIGSLNVSEAYTDTTNIRGMGTNIIFTSSDTGTALISVVYRDGIGNTFDSTTTTVGCEWNTHSLDVTVSNQRPQVSEDIRIYCILFRGGQETPERVSGKRLFFEAYRPATPNTPFGTFYPTYPGTSDSNSVDGLTEPYFFWSTVEGNCVLRAYYKNGLGEVAYEDTVNIVIGSNSL